MGKPLVLALLLVICPAMAFAEEIETKAYLPWDLDSQKTIHVLINSESEIILKELSNLNKELSTKIRAKAMFLGEKMPKKVKKKKVEEKKIEGVMQ